MWREEMERSRDGSLGTYGGLPARLPPCLLSQLPSLTQSCWPPVGPPQCSQGCFILLPSPSSPCLPCCAGSPARDRWRGGDQQEAHSLARSWMSRGALGRGCGTLYLRGVGYIDRLGILEGMGSGRLSAVEVQAEGAVDRRLPWFSTK